MELKYSKLGDSAWYNIKNSDNKEYGVFSLLTVPTTDPDYYKHMDLHIKSDVLEETISKGDIDLLLEIHKFVFESVLKITEENNIWCKIYSNKDIIHSIYTEFADQLGPDYKTRFYGNWIEIKKI